MKKHVKVAAISGRAGVAVFMREEGLFSIQAGDHKPIPRKESEIPLLIGEAKDLIILKEVPQEEVENQLTFYWTQDQALHLTLILFDSDLSKGVRQRAAKVLNDFVRNENIFHHLRSILYARPLPEEADISGALECSESVRTDSISGIRRLLLSLSEDQPYILIVYRAWITISSAPPISNETIKAFETLAIRRGLFRDFSICLSSQDPPAQIRAILELLDEGNRQLHYEDDGLLGYEEVLRPWIERLRHIFPIFDWILDLKKYKSEPANWLSRIFLYRGYMYHYKWSSVDWLLREYNRGDVNFQKIIHQGIEDLLNRNIKSPEDHESVVLQALKFVEEADVKSLVKVLNNIIQKRTKKNSFTENPDLHKKVLDILSLPETSQSNQEIASPKHLVESGPPSQAYDQSPPDITGFDPGSGSKEIDSLKFLS